MTSLARQALWIRMALLLVLLLLAVATGAWRRPALQGSYAHPDEEIARAVVTRVLATKQTDTNWARTDVAALFRYNQFNFSAYYLAAAKLERLARHRVVDVAEPRLMLAHLRQQNLWLGSLLVLLAGLAAWRMAALAGLPMLLCGAGGVVAAALTGACVTLFQDTIYARPEAFVSVLTLGYVLTLLSSRLPATVLLALSGLLVGVLVATKITFIVFAPFPLLVVMARRYADDSASHPHPWQVTGAIAWSMAWIALGFGLGAPYAMRAPWEYLEGVGYLLRQYSSWGWPNGLHDAGPGARFLHGIAYLAYTDGWPVLVLAAIAFAMLVRRAQHRTLLAVAGPLLTLVYFMQTHAFFERNFSHALPVLFALAGLGLVCIATWLVEAARVRPAASPALQGLAVALGAVCVVYAPFAVSRKLHHVLLDDTTEARIATMTDAVTQGGQRPLLKAYSDIAGVPALRGGLCGDAVVKLTEFGDDYSRQQVLDLIARGYAVAGELRGPFDGAPISTLQTYHAANTVFLVTPPDEATCKARLVAPIAEPGFTDASLTPAPPPGWARDGQPPDLAMAGWTHPFFGSWSGSDAHTGNFAWPALRACGDVLVPFATGPTRTSLLLHIERAVDDSHEVLFDGEPPPVAGLAAIRVVSRGCATYLIEARDQGAGWGQWLGIGLPLLGPALAKDAAAPTPARR